MRYSPIVEIGAGTGYWARLASQAGTDIVAHDADPEREPKYFPVKRGGPSMAQRHHRRTLLLCWPPRNEPMASECLSAYTGSTVIYIGEPSGATADDTFHDMLECDWETVEQPKCRGGSA